MRTHILSLGEDSGLVLLRTGQRGAVPDTGGKAVGLLRRGWRTEGPEAVLTGMKHSDGQMVTSHTMC